MPLANSTHTITADSNGPLFGTSVHLIPDYDFDGLDDVFIFNPDSWDSNSGDSLGRGLLVSSGNLDSSQTEQNIDDVVDVEIQFGYSGTGMYYNADAAFHPTSDFNGDGHVDILFIHLTPNLFTEEFLFFSGCQ